MKDIRMNLRAPLSVLLLTASSAAFAHTNASAGGFVQGFAHPLMGVDHLLAMVVVGIWAATLSGAARWLLPAAFVVSMAIGATLGAGIALPMVEPIIALSVLVLGVIVATAVRMPLAVGVALVALFAVFHGHAHFAEMPEEGLALAFGAGMLVATGLLHAIGLLMAVQGQRLGSWLPRAAGALTGLVGVALLLGL